MGRSHTALTDVEIWEASLQLAEAVGGLEDPDRVLDTVTEIAPHLLGPTRCDYAHLYEAARRALTDLHSTQEERVQRETLRATGELAAGLAHHLNNLLTVILGGVQLVLAEVQDPISRRTLKLVEQATLDGAEVVRRVHGFSRTQPDSEVAPLDLNGLIEEALELTQSLWQASALGVRIEALLDPGETPAIIGNPSSLKEMLMNLLLNAGEALPKGGRIAIKTWAAAPWVSCSVTDPGVGMSPEVCRRALEPFFTTKGPKRRGLGLSVAYGIVQRHGGELVIESVQGQGTTVTVRLPARNGDLHGHAPMRAPSGPARSRSRASGQSGR
jgi:signal transduction histidine kinase